MSTPVSVLVKSFNRPYYLDRCLRSVYQHMAGNFRVTVLDDGTPPAYLNEIKRRFPEVHIEYSQLYEAKVAQLQAHVEGGPTFSLRSIPTKLWITGVQKATPIFCLLEDDIWLTQPVNISQMADYMQEREIVMTKFYWGGNLSTFKARMGISTKALQEYQLLLPSGPEWWLQVLLLNRFKLRSVLHRLRLVKEGIYFELPFYSMYSVASAAFCKDYWLNLWQAGQMQADEVHQLSRALHWTRQHTSRFAKSHVELTQTSFISSATNMFKDVRFDVIAANHYLNRAWLQGQFDAMQNYPHDFDPATLKFVFDDAADVRCTYENWLKWIARFKQVYSSMGVVVE